MNWTETYNKYKDSEWMGDFTEYYCKIHYPKMHIDRNWNLGYQEIQDIWGYLICFAETKGWMMYTSPFSANGKFFCDSGFMEIDGDRRYDTDDKDNNYTSFKSTEQAMLWCADKFFEIAE